MDLCERERSRWAVFLRRGFARLYVENVLSTLENPGDALGTFGGADVAVEGAAVAVAGDVGDMPGPVPAACGLGGEADAEAVAGEVGGIQPGGRRAALDDQRDRLGRERSAGASAAVDPAGEWSVGEAGVVQPGADRADGAGVLVGGVGEKKLVAVTGLVGLGRRQTNEQAVGVGERSSTKLATSSERRSPSANPSSRRARSRSPAVVSIPILATMSSIGSRSSATFFFGAERCVRVMPSSTMLTRLSQSGLGWSSSRCARAIAAMCRRIVMTLRAFLASAVAYSATVTGPAGNGSRQRGLSGDAWVLHFPDEACHRQVVFPVQKVYRAVVVEAWNGPLKPRGDRSGLQDETQLVNEFAKDDQPLRAAAGWCTATGHPIAGRARVRPGCPADQLGGETRDIPNSLDLLQQSRHQVDHSARVTRCRVRAASCVSGPSG